MRRVAQAELQGFSGAGKVREVSQSAPAKHVAPSTGAPLYTVRISRALGALRGPRDFHSPCIRLFACVAGQSKRSQPVGIRVNHAASGLILRHRPLAIRELGFLFLEF